MTLRYIYGREAALGEKVVPLSEVESSLAAAERERDEARLERDAFASTYQAVNDVLLSGSPRAPDPTAERVQANLARLMKRAESAESDLRSAEQALASSRAEAERLREALRRQIRRHSCEGCDACDAARAALGKEG